MKTRLLLLFAFLGLAAIAVALSFTRSPPVTEEVVTSVPAPVPAASAVVDEVQTPQLTPPRIVLRGTFVNEQTQLALISSDDEEQRWFKLKEYLNADFYLDGIFKEHVLIRDTNNTMALEIRITDGGATQELVDVVPAIPAHSWVEFLPPIPGIDRLEPNRYRIRRELIMKELKSGEIFKQVLIVPREEGGFAIDRIREGSLVEIIGLRVGDTIHKINDKPLTNITDALDLYKNLDSLDKVDVEITRMHQLQQLHYELN